MGLRQLLAVSLLAMSFSCTYKATSEQLAEQGTIPIAKQGSGIAKARKHPLYKLVPRHRKQIRTLDLFHWTTWALIGNDDDGLFGEEATAKYESTKSPGVLRTLAWNARNPLHNFTFYVIGSAQFENSEVTLLKSSREGTSMLTYKGRAETVYASKGSGVFLGLHGWKPFFSMRAGSKRIFNTYFGWRERGNFGMAISIKNSKQKEEEAVPSLLAEPVLDEEKPAPSIGNV